MKIKLTSVYVDDQDKALRFYTQVLGFAKKADFSQGPFRWLTVASPEEPDGTELQLALNDNPAAKAYQQAMFQQGQPAAMFYTDGVKGDYERIKARGAEFTMPPADVTASTIAMRTTLAATSFSSPSWHAIKGARSEDGSSVGANGRGLNGRRFYTLRPEPLQQVDAWLAPFRRFWSTHVDALKRHLDMDQSTTRTKRKTRRKR